MSFPSEARISLLEIRLLALERRSRLHKWGFLLTIVGGLGLAVLGMADAKPDRWQGKEVSLVDETGKVRASLNLKDDAPGLVLYDRSGKLRLEVSVGPDGTPGISLSDEHGVGRAEFSMFGDSTHLTLHSRKGDELVGLGLHHDETAYLKLYSPESKSYWKAP